MIVAGLSLFEEVPRHPRRRIRHQLTGVPLELGEVVERIGVRQLTGVDQAHEQVAHLGAVQGAIKQRIFAMQYGALERALAEVMPPPGLCRVLCSLCGFSLGDLSFWLARLSA
jgi:hypothetical protein